MKVQLLELPLLGQGLRVDPGLVLGSVAANNVYKEVLTFWLQGKVQQLVDTCHCNDKDVVAYLPWVSSFSEGTKRCCTVTVVTPDQIFQALR